MKESGKTAINEKGEVIARTRERALLLAIPDLMFVIGRDGTFLDYRAERSSSLYAPPEEFLGKNIREVLPGDVADTCMLNLERTLKSGKIHSFEYKLPMAEGIREYEARLVASGEAEVLTIVRDITARKQAEKTLKESEVKYRSVFESTGTAMVIVEEDMTFSLVNSEFEKLSGYPKEEIEGRIKWPEVVAREYHERMMCYHHARRVDPEAAPKNYEFKFIDKGGNIKDVLITTAVIPGTKKSVASLLDITERKKIEEELSLAEAKFRSLVEHSIVGFYILQDGYFPYANPSCAEIFGYTTEEFISSKSVFELIIEEDHDLAGEDIRKLFQKEAQTVVDIYRGRRKDGSVIIFEAQGNLTGYLGRPAIIGTVVDITERRREQEEALRTSRLASLGELAAGVAHEINNPVNGIIGYAELLLERGRSKQEIHELTALIIEEGERIAYIVKSLLSFALDNREASHPVRAHEVMTSALALVGAQIRKDGIGLTVEVPQELPEITVHPQQIQQVFLNIISNSRYALNQRYPGMHDDKTLEIRAETVTVAGRPYVRTVFSDRGAGIPLKVLDKVMDPFFTTKPGGMGTGLGLSISHGIVHSHGGVLVIDSVEGEYTKVTVDLPAAEQT